MAEIRVNGVTLYYEEHGAGAPILGIHGAGSSAAFWSDAAARLAKHGRTIVYDRRGCSRSERPKPYTTNVHQQADDAAALIEALDAAPAVLIRRRDPRRGGSRHRQRCRDRRACSRGGCALGRPAR